MAAGAKKKKKPAANPARGFATTSIASKPRPETVEEQEKPISKTEAEAAASKPTDATANDQSQAPQTGNATAEAALSPEEFERQLEEAQLQIIVDKHASKVKRDAQRQRSRLETDRRLLRGQADSVSSSKWLPQEIKDHVLDLIQAENRFAASNVSADGASSSKMPPEEDMITRLWTLQQTLEGVDFPTARVQAVSQFILDISSNISPPGKDLIWGLEEALEWLARELPAEELPSYEPRGKPVSRGRRSSHTRYLINTDSSKIHQTTVHYLVVQSPPRLAMGARLAMARRTGRMDGRKRHRRLPRRSFRSHTIATLSPTNSYRFTLMPSASCLSSSA